MIVNYKPLLWFMFQIILLVLWYGIPSFSDLPMWVVWSPMIVVAFSVATGVFENPITKLLEKLEKKLSK